MRNCSFKIHFSGYPESLHEVRIYDKIGLNRIVYFMNQEKNEHIMIFKLKIFILINFKKLSKKDPRMTDGHEVESPNLSALTRLNACNSSS